MKTVALVIGVSQYKDASFSSLPGASQDAERIYSSFTKWGLSPDLIIKLQNPTKSEVVKAFYGCRSHFDVEAKFIFYFAGHGQRDSSLHAFESSLVLHDTYAKSVSATGLRLVELMQLIRSLKPQQTFLFIDSCSLRLNSIENPLTSETILSSTESKGLFCLFSSGIQSSFEDPKSKSGYFTNALLHAIGQLRHTKNPSCYDIAKQVELSLLENELPGPEVYHIGSPNIWLFDPFIVDTVEKTKEDSNQFVERVSSLTQIKEYLGQKNSSIWIWGERGLGKTVLAEQLQNSHPNSLYLSFSHGNISQLLQSIIEEIRTQKSELFYNRPPEPALSITLQHLYDFQPSTLLIFDHLDRLSKEDLQKVAEQLDESPLQMVFISRYQPSQVLFQKQKSNLIVWKALGFSLEEAASLIELHKIHNSLSHLLLDQCGGNALKTTQMLVKLAGKKNPFEGVLSKEIAKCLAAIYTCGGYLDEELFCQSFNILPTHLNTLRQYGLVRYFKGGFFPHDSLEELVEKNHWPLPFQRGCHYWSLQIQKTPFNRFACRSLVLLCRYIKNHKPYKKALTQCLETLNHGEYRSFLIDLTHIFLQSNWKHKLLQASDYLVDHEEYALAKDVLSSLVISKNVSIRHHAQKNTIRRLVWTGKYLDAITIYEEVMATNKCINEAFLIAMRNHIGIAHFFLGNFDISVKLFKKNHDLNCKGDQREVGITKYMLGLIYTYRCENLTEAEQLLNTSVLIFESAQFYHWSIVALNGLAVMHNSICQREKALFYLGKALEISEALQNKTFLLQTLKNIARVQLRHCSPHCEEITQTVKKLEELLKEVLKVGHNWATMWAQNILCTVYAHRHQPEKMQPHLDDVWNQTKNYNECHIFTLSNHGHYQLLKNNIDEARHYYNEAKKLCKKTGIKLAEVEIEEDFIGCNFGVSI